METSMHQPTRVPITHEAMRGGDFGVKVVRLAPVCVAGIELFKIGYQKGAVEAAIA
jgi:hypothetical protein